jgi:N-acetylglutamate synthase-like GNAT family acetyltransferase
MIASADTTIRPATLADVRYVEALSNKLNHEVGFVPRVALQRRITGEASGGVTMSLENDDLCGFLHYGSLAKDEARIFQAAIQYDAQRRHHGLALVDQFIERASDAGVRLVSLRCRHGLDSNHFWKSVGFRKAGIERGTRSALVVWYRRLHVLDDLDAERPMPPVPRRTHACPDCGRSATITWGPQGIKYTTCRACTGGRLAKRM